MLRGPDGEMRRLRKRLDEPGPPPARRPVPYRDTGPERRVAALLAELGAEAAAQHALTPGVRVDFYVPQARLVIECQGTWYHGDPARFAVRDLNGAQRRKRRHDAALAALCRRLGLRLLELWESDLEQHPEQCRARLAAALAGNEEVAMSERVRETTFDGGITLAVCLGDLTQEDTAAIVNAANGQLAHGGGVAGAIVRRGGAEIQAESDEWVRRRGPVPTGGVALTGAGSLPAHAVIHAVGPVWHGGDRGEPEQLRRAAEQSLALAEQEGFESIALPAISSGIFGFPKERCAAILFDAATAFAAAHPDARLREIRFTNFDQPTVDIFAAEFDRRWPRAEG